MKVHPYLNFDGQAEEAFNFYKSVFGGQFMTHQKMKDGTDSANLSSEDQNRTMPISLPIAEDTILMASDVIESSGHGLVKGNKWMVSFNDQNEETLKEWEEQLPEDISLSKTEKARLS